MQTDDKMLTWRS